MNILDVRNILNVTGSTQGKKSATPEMNSYSTDVIVDAHLSLTSTNPVQNKVITAALNEKQETLVSGTNIKTVNNTSLLGAGDIAIEGLPTQTGQSGKFLTTDGSVASWDGVTSVAADKSLSNLTDAGEIVAAKMSMPSSTYEDLTLGASGTNYTAPSDGYYFINKSTGVVGEYLVFNDGQLQAGGLSSGGQFRAWFPVKKGTIVNITYSLSGTTNSFRFIYAEGSKSEYVAP